MKQKLPRLKRDKLAKAYAEEPLLWIWRSSASYLEREMDSLEPAPEDFFLDILSILDDIKENPALFVQRRVASLWEEVANETKRASADASREDCDRYATIVVTTLLLLLRSVSKFYYNTTFCNALASGLAGHTSTRPPHVPDDIGLMQEAARELDRHRKELTVWIDEYMDSNKFLSDRIQQQLKKTSESKRQPKQDGPYTLTYNYQGEDRAKRIQFFEMGLVNLNLLQPTKEAGQMEGFFSGEKKDCKLEWCGAQELLYQLIRTLLKQDFISKQTNVSARSIAATQFGFKECSRRKIKDNDQSAINKLVSILNPAVPLPPP